MTNAAITVNGITTEEELHWVLSTTFGFPVYYGHNLDALCDMLTGWVELPLHVEFTGWTKFEMAIGQERAKIVLDCFNDAEGVSVELK